MTKLTTEITIEELQYRIHAHENDLTQMWTADYFLNVQKELLASKQSAKNSADLKTLVISEIVDFYVGFESPGEPETVDEAQSQLIERIEKVFGLAAPVLPKQPELVESLKKVMNSWLAMEPKLAFQPEFTDVMILLDAEPAPAQPVSEPSNSPVIPDAYVLDELGRMTLNGVCEPRVSFGSGWNACRAEMLKTQQNEPQNIPAQPVSEHKPYAWAIEHKVGLPTVVFNKPNTNSWAFKDAVIKELYEAPAQESE